MARLRGRPNPVVPQGKLTIVCRDARHADPVRDETDTGTRDRLSVLIDDCSADRADGGRVGSFKVDVHEQLALDQRRPRMP